MSSLNRAFWCAALVLYAACADPLPQTPPRQLSESPFQYPEELWDAGVEGETLLRLFVTPAGMVDTVRVETASGHAAFDSSAVRWAPELQFEPARRGEDAVGAWVLLPVQFHLQSTPAPTDTSR